MNHYYYVNDVYSGWGWFLWVGIVVLLTLSLGNFGYTYRNHRRFMDMKLKDALDILDERYAAGELTDAQYFRMKTENKKDLRDRETGARLSENLV